MRTYREPEIMAHKRTRTHKTTHKLWPIDTEGPTKKSRDPQNHESKPFVFVGPKTLSLLNSTFTVSTPTFATLPANTFPSIFSAIYVGKPYFCGSLVLANVDPRNDPQTFCKSKFRFHTRLPPPHPPPFLLRSTTPCAVPALSVIWWHLPNWQEFRKHPWQDSWWSHPNESISYSSKKLNSQATDPLKRPSLSSCAASLMFLIQRQETWGDVPTAPTVVMVVYLVILNHIKSQTYWKMV